MEMKNSRSMEVKSVRLEEEKYPRLLKIIKNPPKILYYIGDISLASKAAVAIVGARKASNYGKWVSHQLAGRLAEYDIVSVSGMAYGIDAYCHKGSLDNNGKTIAVLGGGANVCYPKANRLIMEKIAETGLILSEQEPGTQPIGWMFPMRNRIISGISVSTIIVEAGFDSGSLITAEYAVSQGRNVFAVPGNINSINSIGTNKLIRNGVLPITCLDDIIEDLGVEVKISQIKLNGLSNEEKIVYNLVSENGEISRDFICFKTGKQPSEVSALVTILEMKGLLHSALGKIFVAK